MKIKFKTLKLSIAHLKAEHFKNSVRSKEYSCDLKLPIDSAEVILFGSLFQISTLL